MAGKTISRALLAVIPLFAFAPVVVEAGTPAAAAAAALVADDACATRTHDAPKPGCALEALQTARAAVGSTVAHRAGENPTAKDNLEKEIQFAKVATEEIGLTLECDSPPCAVRGEEDWDSADHPLTSATARIGARSPGCFEWNAYFWPQASFWAGQIGRRLETVGFDNMQNLTRVRKFAHQAAYLVSVMYMDPRSGHHWSEQVQSFFTQVAESDSLDMPMLPEFFRAASKRSKMLVSIINLGWFEGLACDLAWWQRELAGSHADDPLCWSKVQHPGYGYSPAGSSITRPLPAIPADIDPLDHPEYLACQDYPLNSTYYEGICPFGGHVQHWNGIEHWGKGVPKRGQEAVFQCQQTLGIGGFTDLMKHPQMEILFYDNPNISLGPMWEDNKTINPEDVNWTGRFNKEVNDRWMQNIFDAVHHKD